jgi:hypothetical protein
MTLCLQLRIQPGTSRYNDIIMTSMAMTCLQRHPLQSGPVHHDEVLPLRSTQPKPEIALVISQAPADDWIPGSLTA